MVIDGVEIQSLSVKVRILGKIGVLSNTLCRGTKL